MRKGGGGGRGSNKHMNEWKTEPKRVKDTINKYTLHPTHAHTHA